MVLSSPAGYKEMIDRTNVDNVMVARGALGNPFIFSRYNELIQSGSEPGEPSIEEVEKIAVKHCRLLEREYPEAVATIKARKTILWYF